MGGRLGGEGEFVCREPYCGLSLGDEASLDRHYKVHLDQELDKLTRLRVKKVNEVDLGAGLRATRNIAFERLKARRSERISSEHPQSVSSGVSSDLRNSCPLCRFTVEGTAEDLRGHFSVCLRAEVSEDNNPAQEDFIEVDDEDFEEYEWAGQKRVRSTSLFRGGLKAAGFLTIQQTREDEVLDVLGDGDTKVGGAQYNDSDLLDVSNQESEESESVRESEVCESGSCCKICMSPYSTPLASTVCWHVHCETCWLLALGTKRLCPQCKVIVSPGDLRKLYL